MKVPSLTDKEIDQEVTWPLQKQNPLRNMANKGAFVLLIGITFLCT